LNVLIVTLTRGVSSRNLESHKDDYDVGDESENRLITFLDHTSHLSVVVWKLATGYSEIISGNFCFGWTQEMDEATSSIPETGRYQYNVEEKDVKVFALGTCSAVL